MSPIDIIQRKLSEIDPSITASISELEGQQEAYQALLLGEFTGPINICLVKAIDGEIWGTAFELPIFDKLINWDVVDQLLVAGAKAFGEKSA